MSAAIKRKSLGRGLDALIPGAPRSGVQDNPASILGGSIPVHYLPLSRIEANPDQPRKVFDDEALSGLANSIRIHGVLQPIVVRPSGDKFQIVAGERRFRASKLAGLDSIPALIKDTSDPATLELALIENVQREDLTPLEEARGYAQLIDAYHLKQQEASERLGLSRSALANKLRLLTLPGAVQLMLERGELTEGHARALLGLGDESTIEELAVWVAQNDISVREVERYVQQARGKSNDDEPSNSGAKATQKKLRYGTYYKQLEQRFERSLATKVQLQAQESGDSVRGKIVISYHSLDELERLTAVLESGGGGL